MMWAVIVALLITLGCTACQSAAVLGPTRTPAPLPTLTGTPSTSPTPTSTPGADTFALRVNDTLVTGSTVPLTEGIVHVIPAPNDQGNRYQDGTTVRLTVTPGETFVFSRWSGACRGTDDSCALTMRGDMEVEAAFEQAYPLFVNDGQVTGSTHALPGGGGVIVSPAPSAPGDRYFGGAVVSVTWSQKEGVVFTGWTGDCITPDASCALVMDRERRVTAGFSQAVSDVIGDGLTPELAGSPEASRWSLQTEVGFES